MSKGMPRFLALLLCVVGLPLAAADYVVLVSKETQADAGWAKVVDRLQTKYQAQVLTYQADVLECQAGLRQTQPRWVCWVARPVELGTKSAYAIHQLARDNDSDPYEDFQWGIISGRTAELALKLAAPAEPLTIRKVGASTAFASDCVQSGYWFSEFKAGEVWVKDGTPLAVKGQGAADSTESIAKRLNEADTDCFITSGHASETQWEPGYRYRNGIFTHRDGVLVGKSLDGKIHEVRSPNPKVYLAVGNCLIGNVPKKEDCMALAWLNTGGALQMLGYVEPTWYGYAGWGVLDYFVEQPGRFNVSEARLANHHALLWTLGEAKAGRLKANIRGLEFDQNVTVLYGDPKWSAKMAPGPLRWEETLVEGTNGEWTWTITPKAGAGTFVPVDTNGSERGGRPLVAFLPRHAAGWEVLSGQERKPITADDFVLLPNPGPAWPAPERLVIRLRKR